MFFARGEAGEEVHFPNIRRVKHNASLNVISSNTGSRDCLLEAFTNTLLRCQVLLPANSDWTTHLCQNSLVSQNGTSFEEEDVNLVFRFAEHCSGIRIDSFEFTSL